MTRPALVIALLVAALSAPAAHAGMPFAACDEPGIFRDGALNVVVLPYEADLDAGGNPLAIQVARELPLLLQSASLAAVLRYGSVGSVGLVDSRSDGRCTAEVVYGKIDREMTSGQALLLVWGTLFEDDRGLQVQTFARLLRKGTREIAQIDIGNQPFLAELTAQTVSFPARVLGPEDLQHIHDAFQRSSILHEAPSDDSPGRAMYDDLRDGRGFAYRVQRVQPDGEWAEVHSQRGERGWVRMQPLVEGKTFGDWFPEVRFIDGAGGYLRFQQPGSWAWPLPPLQARTRAIEALDRYVRSDSARAESPARAVALQMSALLQTTAPGAVEGDRATAAAKLDRAKACAPYSVEAAQLSSLARMDVAYSDRPELWRPSQFERELRQAASSAPDNPLVVQNLRTFYALLDSTRGRAVNSKYEVDSLRMRRTVARLDSVRLVRMPFRTDSTGTARRLVDLNVASLNDIDDLPGIDRGMAERIVKARPFKGLDDPGLLAIIGRETRVRIEGRAKAELSANRLMFRIK